ncbi:MAG TPA: hypothetical protein VEM58_00760, partial [Streptosporangiaceae bacterium]|nr:hypothetical protein [Streptosporangiaceae bacterium]
WSRAVIGEPLARQSLPRKVSAWFAAATVTTGPVHALSARKWLSLTLPLSVARTAAGLGPF